MKFVQRNVAIRLIQEQSSLENFSEHSGHVIDPLLNNNINDNTSSSTDVLASIGPILANDGI